MNGGCLPLPIPSSQGEAVSSPSPTCVHTGKKSLLPLHKWRQRLPQLAKIKLLSLEKAAGAGQISPRRPCHPSTPRAAEPAHPTAGYHGDSIPPGKCVLAPLCPLLLGGTRCHPFRAARSRGQSRRAGDPRQRRWPGERRSNGSECPCGVGSAGRAAERNGAFACPFHNP